MTTKPARPDHKRAARAADLVATLAEQLPLGHPARDTVRELRQLFGLRHEDIRDLLERVPGRSMQQKGERLGIPRQTVWAIWHGKYKPGPDVMARIRAAAEDKVDA